MGRSRKPLTGQPVRGFESHPLRHPSPPFLDCRGRARLSYWFRSGRFTPSSFHVKEGGHCETDVSTQQPSPQAHPRLPGADAHQERPRGARAAAPEGTQAPERLRAPVAAPMESIQSGQEPPALTEAHDERLRPAERLRRRADYLRCYRTGRRRHGSLAILYFVPNQLEGPRLGITASRKVGKAVVRHRLKRRIKEIYRRWPHRSQLPALDLVIHLKPEARESDF